MAEPIPVRIVAEADEALLELLGADPRFSVGTEICANPAALAKVIGDARIVVTRSSTPMTREVIRACPSLELIAQATSGSDNIDQITARERGVSVLTTPGANAAAVAESVLGAMIVLQRRLPALTAKMRRGKWNRGDCAQRNELTSTAVGIIGVGRVGSRLARLLGALGRRPLGFDPYVPEDELRSRGVHPVDSLPALLDQCSIVTLHVPLTDETRGMIGRDEIEAMPAPRIVINTSRGAVVDPLVIKEALDDGVLDGAWIDVFPEEPARLEGWSHPNVLLTPHIAGCSREARSTAARRLYEGICAAVGFEPR